MLEKRTRQPSAARPRRPPLRSIPELSVKHRLVLPIIVRVGRLDGTPPRRGWVRHKPKSMQVDWQMLFEMRERVRAAGCGELLARVVAIATASDAPNQAEIVELSHLLDRVIAISGL